MYKANAVHDVRDDWALRAEDSVRKAFKKHSKTPAFPIPAATIDDNVKSSWFSKTGWIKPHPFHVLVFTESGNFGDPMSYNDLFRYWNKVVKTLQDDPWHADAGWESINAAVQYVWIEPRIIA